MPGDYLGNLGLVDFKAIAGHYFVMDLNSKFIDIKGLGIGEKSFEKLQKLGLSTPLDLFYCYPRSYENYQDITEISAIKPLDARSGEVFTVKGTLLGIANKKTRRRGFTVTEAVIADNSGTLKVIWFNQPYLAKMLQAGRDLVLHGKVSYDSFAKSLVLESPNRATKREIVAIYPAAAGITSFFIGKLFSKIRYLITEIDEWLPEEILKKYDLLPIREALLAIHLPKDEPALASARKRLAFDELFSISLQRAIARERYDHQTAAALNIDIELLKQFIDKLPFTLTDDQKKAIWRIVKDIEQSKPMHRLLNGDVGSGKTVVAACASYIAVKSGHQVLLMVPTEILASQHYATFKSLFLTENLSVGLITGSKKLDKEADILIGTQALIQESFETDRVGLVIVDEQHRFGVKQRELLKKKTEENEGYVPHFLSMTATPIPRTLHLALFGDLDITLIRQKPSLRKMVKTRFVKSDDREKAYDFIRQQIIAGRQAFVICPLIEDGEEDLTKAEFFEEERKSVKSEYDRLSQIFPEFEIAALHGKMKPIEKNTIMDDFSLGKIKILVSTSVVEVGVDIPNASVMLIENAEQFGLAQLHQFRGRIGRSEHQSYCFLFSGSNSERVLSRLGLIEQTDDGFALAEEDLKLRGPGSMFGLDQSGMIDLKIASFSDQSLILAAIEAAKDTVKNIDSYPRLEARLKSTFANRHLE